MGAAISITQLSCGSGAGFNYGIDMGDTSYIDDGLTFSKNTFGVADIRLSSGIYIYSGTTPPDGTLTAPRGSLYVQTDGAAGSQLWINETGSTGWCKVTTTT